jgi:Tol biopolymer transport system component
MSSGIDCVDLTSGAVTRLTDAGGDPACSPLGNLIAYVRGKGDREEIWLIEPDGAHNRKLIDGGFPCWLSDGKTLCFHARKQNTIQAVDVTATTIIAKTLLDNAGSWYPTVSPDGKRAAVVQSGNLVVTDLATKERRTCELRGAGAGFTGWSPDGKQVGFGSFGGDSAGLWIFDLASGKVKQVAGGSCTMPVWSRDGKWLSYDVRGRGRGEVWALETKAFDLIPWDDPAQP